MKKPILIERKEDKHEYIHLGKGMYKSTWSIKNDDIREFPLEAFNNKLFTFYFAKK